MNTALLSARKRTVTGELRAELPLCGRSVLAWQVTLARQLGCERIICLCDAPSADMLELQRVVEGDGGEFHAVKTSLQLVALLRSDDVLLVMLDGLVVEPDLAQTLAFDHGKLRKGVFTLEAGGDLAEAHPADFERIDATRCWSGLAVMRAAVAQKLADLPEDGEIVSLLLRLALQSRTETLPVDLDQHRETDWVLAKENAMLIQREDAMLDLAVPKMRWPGPFNALAAKIVRVAGAKWIAQGPVLAGSATILAALCALLLVANQYAVIGLGIATMSAFLASFTRVVGDARTSVLAAAHPAFLPKYIKDIIDVSTIITLVLALILSPFSVMVLPVLSIGLVRIAAISAPARVAPFWNDRALHLAGLTICAAYGVLSEGLAVLGLLALAQVLLGSLPASGDTSK